jgi:hypothetical protein
MSRKFIHFCLLALLAGVSAWALADPPAVVGRISAVQGQVTLAGEDDPVAASLNWPVTAANHINTATGARTEFRVGSTAVRVDGDSDLEITEMDDDLLRLRLNYGSVSIRVRSPELLRDFELTTPQARITMIEPGVLRVDVDRVADTSQVSVLAGIARVDGAGSSVTVNNGRHVDVTNEDVRTSVARRDGFDAWAEDRDRLDQGATTATRFVSSGMTGYEELDRNGSWTEDAEYGTLWTPRNVASDWAPYRDGRWIWLAPWGWTWVDNAPWGYAPSHYGRWVVVNRRWCWAPGRSPGRPVWSPALVGWVGGDGFTRDRRPGLGWFPLSPRERYVPGYRVSSEYEKRLTWTHNGRPYKPRADDHNNFRERRDGLTVLPREQFEGRRTVQVTRGPQVIPTWNRGNNNVSPVAPPQPGGPRRVADPNRRNMADRDNDGRPDRFERNDRNDRNDRQPGGRVITAPSQPVNVAPQPPGRQVTTTLAPGQFGHPDTPPQTINPNDVRLELRQRMNQQHQPAAGVTPVPPVPQVAPTTRERFDRNDDDNRRRLRSQPEQRQEQRHEQSQEQRPQPQPQPQRQFTPPAPAQPQSQPPRQFSPPPQPVQQPQRENRDAGRSEPRKEPEKRNDNNRGDRRANQQ